MNRVIPQLTYKSFCVSCHCFCHFIATLCNFLKSANIQVSGLFAQQFISLSIFTNLTHYSKIHTGENMMDELYCMISQSQ